MYLGEPLSEDAVRVCLGCHVTSVQAITSGTGPVALDHGISCEKCHGPGGNHVMAIKAGFPDKAIVDPRMASGSRIVALCAKCHSPRTGKLSKEDPTAGRFPGTTLTWSRCFLESQDALDCITCHDPHRDTVKSAVQYEAKCLSCHSGGAQSRNRRVRLDPNSLLDPSAPTVCPVNSAKGCIGCHMPLITGIVPHSEFTDHFIRVHPD